jgi:hypothetical protein
MHGNGPPLTGRPVFLSVRKRNEIRLWVDLSEKYHSIWIHCFFALWNPMYWNF